MTLEEMQSRTGNRARTCLIGLSSPDMCYTVDVPSVMPNPHNAQSSAPNQRREATVVVKCHKRQHDMDIVGLLNEPVER